MQQLGGAHHKTRRAIAALHGVLFDEHLLDRMQFAVLGQALDGADARAVGARRRRETGQRGEAVEPDGAGAAFPFLAAGLWPHQPQILAQHTQQRLTVGAIHRDAFAVDDTLDRFIAVGAMSDGGTAEARAAARLAPEQHHLFRRGQSHTRSSRLNGFKAALDERANSSVRNHADRAHRQWDGRPGPACRDACRCDPRSVDRLSARPRPLTPDDGRRNAAQGDAGAGHFWASSSVNTMATFVTAIARIRRNPNLRYTPCWRLSYCYW